MLTFRVPGPPVPKGRHKSRVAGKCPKHFIQTYTPKETVAFEVLVAKTARAAGATILEGPIALVVISVWPYRKGDPKWVRESGLYFPKDTKPDGDNVYKAVADGLEGVAYTNDSKVSFHKEEDLWGPEECIYVKAWQMTSEGRQLPGWCR